MQEIIEKQKVLRPAQSEPLPKKDSVLTNNQQRSEEQETNVEPALSEESIVRKGFQDETGLHDA
jgi:hypothetical protein